MSKEFRCISCSRKIITEREDTSHTTYSSGLCDECKSKPEPEPQPEVEPEILQTEEKPEPEPEIEQDKPDPLACKECGFVAKTEFGLKSHMRIHESK